MSEQNENPTPKSLGYTFPAEWEPHCATWLSYPHEESYSWPGTLQNIFPCFNLFIRELAKGEQVCINIREEKWKHRVLIELEKNGTDLEKVSFYLHPTNDAWCRDHGPAFVVNPQAAQKKVVVIWKFNAWGGKYPHNLDEQVPARVAEALGLPVFYPGIVMEGGSVEFNGKGTLLTTTACLLHENRNPGLGQEQIEQYLCEYYGVEQVLWLGEGIEGDDTNGHIDDMTRFFREDAVITMAEANKKDPNHRVLADNLKLLSKMRTAGGKQLDIVEIPMPEPVWFEGQRLPASYANFYISNHAVIVPVFRCRQDDKAIYLLEECFPDRKVTGLDSVELIWGLGSFHCMSQQEPHT